MGSWERAKREGIKLIVGISSDTGGGKTMSGLLLARGIVGPQGKIAVIDADNRRSRYYADDHEFQVQDLYSPFTPARYLELVESAEKGGFACVLIDSMSHEWAGVGGCLDMHDAELDRMAGKTNWGKRDACNMAAWIQPKKAHKKMLDRLLTLDCHLIMCFRTKNTVEMVRNDQGKMEVIPKKHGSGFEGMLPITEPNLPYELTISMTMSAEHPGFPVPIKIPEPLREMFPRDKVITVEHGERLVAWAEGRDKKPALPAPSVVNQLPVLVALLAQVSDPELEPKICTWGAVDSIEKLTAEQISKAIKQIEARIAEA